MPKNLKGGKKFKQIKKNSNIKKRHIPIIQNFDENEKAHFFYGKVLNLLGNSWINVEIKKDEQKIECLGKICGSMYKKEWIKKDDIVLCSIRQYTETQTLKKIKVDITFKYNPDEIQHLKQNKYYNEISKSEDDLFINEDECENNDNNNTDNNNNIIITIIIS